MKIRLQCIALMLAIAAIGCGESAPPLEELELRDALLADPLVVASMEPEERRQLAERITEASEQERQDIALDVDEHGPEPWPDEQVKRLDEVLREHDEDAFILGMVARQDNEVELLGYAPAAEDGDEVEGSNTLPPLVGQPADANADLERSALEGDAGQVLRSLLRDSGASRLERVTGWPIGAVAMDDTVFVNGAWLAALGAHDAQPLPIRVPPPQPPQPPPQPSPETAPVQPPDANQPQIVSVIVTTAVVIRAAANGCDKCGDSLADRCNSKSCNSNNCSSNNCNRSCSVHDDKPTAPAWLCLLLPLLALQLGGRRPS